jgi:hypothetical protein
MATICEFLHRERGNGTKTLANYKSTTPCAEILSCFGEEATQFSHSTPITLVFGCFTATLGGTSAKDYPLHFMYERTISSLTPLRARVSKTDAQRGTTSLPPRTNLNTKSLVPVFDFFQLYIPAVSD